jgi:hypothetical protein
VASSDVTCQDHIFSHKNMIGIADRLAIASD